ncbi:hypothetical protein DFH08DRAFT_969216 [Mycena albidolilacea]|uniref:ARID domain-containing protein n=1 Tax=Mycena albidolilacea TaxID=1033008 RepID=A0AAD7EHJ0_9AGAR|nr:hypothetical protein DFH08DRAFT_969216 [Mycena albidolilacea]
MYKNFCTQRSLVHNPRMMSIETQPLDLYDLHTQVMLEGGAANIASRDLWSVISGRIGFAQFPASDTEPAKSGPGVAQHLAHAYKEYLAVFENVYFSTIMDSLWKNHALTAAQRPMAMGGFGGNHGPGGRSGGIADPSQMQLAIAYANIPLPELRRRGIPEQLIQFIEANRLTLLQALALCNQLIQRPDPSRGPTQGGQPPFGGPSGHAPEPFGNMPHPGIHNPMDSQQPQQPQQPGIARPSREHLQAAMAHITKLKSDYCLGVRMLANVPAIDVPTEQRMEYNTVLEQLHRACIDLDHILPMLFVVLKESSLSVQTAIQQRAMISPGSTRFLATLETLRTMFQQVQHMNESFVTILAGLVGMGPMPPGGPMEGMPPRPSLNHLLPPPQINQLKEPPPIPPQPTNSLPPQQQPPNRPGISLQPPLNRVKRPGTASSPNAPSPTPPPVASESTAVNNAPTPRDMSSPQAPKSPKGKPKPKPPQKRKPSIKAAAAPPLPPPEPATAPSLAGSNKRACEDEVSPPQHNMQRSTSSNAPGSNREGWPSNEASKKREQRVANVKTEEDRTAFLEQMTELFRMATGNAG